MHCQEALAIFSFLLAISRATSSRHRLIGHVQGSTETGRRAIISNLCRSLDRSSKERTAEKKGNYRATDHTTLHSVISGDCLTRKWPAKSTLNNSKKHDYSNARHMASKCARINIAFTLLRVSLRNVTAPSGRRPLDQAVRPTLTRVETRQCQIKCIHV